MDGIVRLVSALTLAVVVLAMVLVVLRRRPSGPDPQLRHCSNCRTPMSLRRVSLFESFTLRRTWICPHCGTRMSKAGKGAGEGTA